MVFKRIAALLLWLLVTLTSAFGFMSSELKIAPSDFFCGTLDHAEQNDIGTRDTCQENGWLNDDTLSGYCVAAKNADNFVGTFSSKTGALNFVKSGFKKMVKMTVVEHRFSIWAILPEPVCRWIYRIRFGYELSRHFWQ